MNAEIVWVTITARASAKQGLPRFHALVECCRRRVNPGARIPTSRDAAEQVGCPPCRYCVDDVALSDRAS